MASRAIRARGLGTSSIGLGAGPVKIYAAARSTSEVSFNLLHAPCGGRVRQHFACPDCAEGVPLEKDEIAKGYEYAKGQFVQFTPDELDELDAESDTGAISIADFVDPGAVGAVWVERSHYLAPDKGAGKSYHLLWAALRVTGRAAIATHAARGKQHLVLIRPVEGLAPGLVMHTLRYADEVRAFAEVPMPTALPAISAEEIDLASSVVTAAPPEWDPDRYSDPVKERRLALIKDRIDAVEKRAATETPAPGAKVIDLIQALRISMEASKGDFDLVIDEDVEAVRS